MFLSLSVFQLLFLYLCFSLCLSLKYKNVSCTAKAKPLGTLACTVVLGLFVDETFGGQTLT